MTWLIRTRLMFLAKVDIAALILHSFSAGMMSLLLVYAGVVGDGSTLTRGNGPQGVLLFPHDRSMADDIAKRIRSACVASLWVYGPQSSAGGSLLHAGAAGNADRERRGVL